MPLDFTDLREMKKRRDVDGLMDVLETGDVKECREAICMLGELRSKKAITTLIGFLETDDVQIRSNAAWALGQIGHVKAVLPLIGLMNDPIENIRINAAWSLGRIGDKRALSVLKYAVKNGSTDLRKHSLEAISRIESKANEKWRINSDEPDISDLVDIPLIEIDIPRGMECNYISRVEDEDSQTDYENMPGFSRDVLLKDSKDPFFEDDKRRIVIGLRDDSKGQVSVDIIFRYKDGNNGDSKSSSVWLQMSNRVIESVQSRIKPEIEKINYKPKDITRKNSSNIKRKSKIKQSRKQKAIEYDQNDDINYVSQGYNNKEIDESDIEEIPEERVIRRKFSRSDRRTTYEIPEEKPDESEYEFETSDNNQPAKVKTVPKLTETIPEPEFKQEPLPAEFKQEPAPAEFKQEPEPSVPVNSGSVSAPGTNVNSAVQLLSDIGMSGMTNAASTVTQLSGEEAESINAQLRTISIDEVIDEIKSLGDSIVMIGVELNGVGEAGEVRGEMQMYISSPNALDVANELLCNSPDAAIKDFNDDIVSTLKETANIFGGQYVSAISEYIGVPLSLKTPSFNNGSSSNIAESLLKNAAGKIEFALATNLSLGNNRIGRLIMLVDPKSFDVIIQKLN